MKRKINSRLLKLIVGVLTAVLVLVIVFSVDGCRVKRETAQEEVQAPGENGNLGLPLMETDNVEDIAIETAYVTLYYPGQWEEYLLVETVDEEIGQSVAFNAEINDEKYWLFTLYFGGTTGMPVGVLDSGEGYFLDVTVEMSDFIPDESWTREDADLYCAMQEGVNAIIDNLRDNAAFNE